MTNAAGRLVAFGEVMLRLSPPRQELLLQTPHLDVWLAGAEANVATQLALLGHDVTFASRVPDNDLGRAAISELRSHGINTSAIVFGGDRMGLYFVTPGAGPRASDVLYDRDGSSFATAPLTTWDWDEVLADADRLHLSGITPALGPRSADIVTAAAEAAAARGVAVSFDGNWRSKLWARWISNPGKIIKQIVQHADILFGNHRDIAVMLGTNGDLGEAPAAAAAAAFAAFPKLRVIATTTREVISTNFHRLGASITTRDQVIDATSIDIDGIVDRIGTGDAFVAGVLDKLLRGEETAAALTNGLALAVLKHTVAGDASRFRREDLTRFLSGHRDIVR